MTNTPMIATTASMDSRDILEGEDMLSIRKESVSLHSLGICRTIYACVATHDFQNLVGSVASNISHAHKQTSFHDTSSEDPG